MSDQFVGEIRAVGFNFAPIGWAACDGQLLAISQNTALFSLLGTFYGGDGRTTFALPNLQGSAPMDQGQGAGLTDRPIGETGGTSTVTLTAAQLAPHAHAVNCLSTVGNAGAPGGNVWAAEARGRPPAYSSAGANVALNAQALASAGSGGAHNNMSPFVTVLFIIAMQGIYPSRS